jgi:hypothetical protein
MSRLLEDGRDIRAALAAVGELLAAEGEEFSIVIIGGAAMNLLGLTSRPTRDVDILAWGIGSEIVRPPQPLPDVLQQAIRAVAVRFDLPLGWLNTGPVSQWDTGLPPGLSTRLHWRDFEALHVGIIDRYDLIFFKVYAAADDSPVGRHYRDLITLQPTEDELAEAVAWVRGTQDPSEGFAFMLERMLRQLRHDLGQAQT